MSARTLTCWNDTGAGANDVDLICVKKLLFWCLCCVLCSDFVKRSFVDRLKIVWLWHLCIGRCIYA